MSSILKEIIKSCNGGIIKMPIKYSSLVNNNENLLSDTLKELKIYKPKILYISTHGTTNNNVFIIPKNVWIFFVSPNKEPAIGMPTSNFVSGNPIGVQNILQKMHNGNYDNLESDPNFNNFRVYPPGGIIEDLDLNAVLIYNSGRWTFSGVMKSENYLKTFNRDELLSSHGISTTTRLTGSMETINSKLLLYNDTSDFNFNFDPKSDEGMKTSISELLQKRKNKSEKVILFISACRVLSRINNNKYYNCSKLSRHNKFKIPIPSKTLRASPPPENQMNSVWNGVNLRQGTVGIGNTREKSNYFWLKDNKDELLNLFRDDHSNLSILQSFYSNELEINTINIDRYCKLISKIINFYKNNYTELKLPIYVNVIWKDGGHRGLISSFDSTTSKYKVIYENGLVKFYSIKKDENNKLYSYIGNNINDIHKIIKINHIDNIKTPSRVAINPRGDWREIEYGTIVSFNNETLKYKIVLKTGKVKYYILQYDSRYNRNKKFTILKNNKILEFYIMKEISRLILPMKVNITKNSDNKKFQGVINYFNLQTLYHTVTFNNGESKNFFLQVNLNDYLGNSFISYYNDDPSDKYTFFPIESKKLTDIRIPIRVRINWEGGKIYNAKIMSFDRSNSEYKVLYDDGDIEYFHLDRLRTGNVIGFNNDNKKDIHFFHFIN